MPDKDDVQRAFERLKRGEPTTPKELEEYCGPGYVSKLIHIFKTKGCKFYIRKEGKRVISYQLIQIESQVVSKRPIDGSLYAINGNGEVANYYVDPDFDGDEWQ